MTSNEIPEIKILLHFVEEFPAHVTPQKTALAVMIEVLSQVIPGTPTTVFLEFTRLVNHLPAVVNDFPPGGVKSIANRVVERVLVLMNPHKLTSDSRNYYNSNAGHFEFIESSLDIFSDIQFDGDRLIAEMPGILDSIGELKSKIGQTTSLSDPSRAVLMGQLDLLVKCMGRFQTSGVGPFRESMFSVYGRIVVQLDGDDSVTPADKRTIIDDFLRIVAVTQVASDVLKIGGPVAMKLLTSN